MSLASLYTICLDRIYRFLKEGVWKFGVLNPFSDLPTRAVDNLMEFTQSRGEDPPIIADVILLLISGRLTRLDLSPFHLLAEQESIVSSIQTGGDISLQNFLSHCDKPVISYLVGDIISLNPYLEELHLNIYPGFDVIRKCQNLRILRLYRSFGMLWDDYVPIDLSVLSCLRNLEVLYVPNMDIDAIANVLDVCPKLISIGLNDSLDSLEETAHRRLKNSLLNCAVGTHFQLRRCVWGKHLRIEDPHEKSAYKSRFCDKMRFAVTLCPLIQELIFQVHAKDAIKELRALKQLTLLRIDFIVCEDDFVPDFVALLQEIGPQIKHLSVLSNRRVPVDVICDCCLHLQSFEIDGPTVVNDSSNASGNFPLKRLKLYSLYEEVDKESLLFLLSNCMYLEELFLDDAEIVDDTLLNQIFERNPLRELKVSCIEYCDITREGFQMFMKKAASIQTVLITSDEGKYVYDVKSLFKDPNLRCLKGIDVRRREFFDCRLSPKRF
ncbi:hypothetical protein AVEN_211480-1 [Araneus ventricosus]|uniref:F-box domain-containing protein n=1 Tax=Araneus ventricosus TaxID=182803 RepID=A0A4Y2M5A5_ARAVE|nr:hypothetical protein AVEN_211480-1 [Araneus ventricosus]